MDGLKKDSNKSTPKVKSAKTTESSVKATVKKAKALTPSQKALARKLAVRKPPKKPIPSLQLKNSKTTLSTEENDNFSSAPFRTQESKSSNVPAPTSTPTPKVSKNSDFDLEFIGRFPLRKNNSDKKLDNKKASLGPVFEPGDYKLATFNNPLSRTYYDEFKTTYLGRHTQDSADVEFLTRGTTDDIQAATLSSFQRILDGTLDMFLLNMKDIPLDLPKGLTIGASFKREDPRDVLVTRSTYGAVQELPFEAKIAVNSKRRVMQIRSLRSDLKIVPVEGDVLQRLELIENSKVDALVLSWNSLRRLNLSPRYYVSLQAEVMVPAPCQGTVGVICRETDESLLAKLRYVEDSEASWSSRCERAFVAKMGGKSGAPIGALAHRKGTQDPWILDIAVGDSASGEILKHREIGTSRCKPESLADKAFAGILSKGARRFMF